MSTCFCFRAIGVSTIITAVYCFGGCGDRPKVLPATYPVHGTVKYKDGKPVTGGLVQFRPATDTRATTTGLIQADGSYSLVTRRDGLAAPGAIAGPNRVTITPSRSERIIARRTDGGRPEEQMGTIMITTYPTPYDVAPHDNEFNCTIDRPPE